MTNSKLFKLCLFCFNLLFITISFKGNSTIFYINMYVFSIFYFIYFLKNRKSIDVVEKIKNKKTIFFGSILILYLVSFSSFIKESDETFLGVLHCRFIAIVFLTSYFLGFSINLLKDKTLVFISIGVLLDTFIRVYKLGLENFSIDQIFIANHHAPYNLTIVCSLLLSFFYLQKNGDLVKKYRYIIICFMSFLIFLSFNNPHGRAGFINIILAISFIIFTFLKTKKFKQIITTFGILIICFFLTIYKNENFFNKFNNKQLENDVRVFIWKNSFEIVKKNISVFGDGFYRKNVLIQDKWKEINFEEGINYNAHNTFLEIIMELGIFGLILTLIILFFPMLYFLKNKNLYFMLISLMFFLQSFVESILSLGMFISLHMIFLTLIFIHKDEKESIS